MTTGSLRNRSRTLISARPLGILCIGRVPAFYPRPMFEDAGWGKRLPLDRVLFENRWPEDADAAGPTPTAY